MGSASALSDVLHQLLDPLAPIDVIEDLSFNVGSAIKYLWRAGLKPGESADHDLARADWYVKRGPVAAQIDVGTGPTVSVSGTVTVNP
jgi:hypothetical protein